MTPDAVAAIVVNLDGGEMLQACLKALPAAGAAEVLVVDNGSGPDEVSRLAASPGVTLVRLSRNEGFAGPANRGVQAARSPLVALVNNDCTLEPGYLSACAGALVADRGLVAAQGVVLDASGGRVDTCGIGWNGRGEAIPLHHGEPPPRPEAPSFAVPGVSATAAVYRRQAFLAAGGFEPSFFAWYEDADLSLRLARAGGRFACIPSARARHLGTATGQREPAVRWRRLLANRIRTLRRNLAPAPRRRALLAGLLTGTGLREAARELGWSRAVAAAVGAALDAAACRSRDAKALLGAPPLPRLPR